MFFLENNCGGLGEIVHFVQKLLDIAIILIGVVLVVLVIIDIAKAIIASEEKEVKGYQKAAIRRGVYFLVIFFVVGIVTLLFNLLGKTSLTGNEGGPTWIDCWKDPLGEYNPN